MTNEVLRDHRYNGEGVHCEEQVDGGFFFPVDKQQDMFGDAVHNPVMKSAEPQGQPVTFSGSQEGE